MQIVLPKRNRAQIVHNDVTGYWGVQRAGLILCTGSLRKCERYCTTRGFEVTNLGAIEGVRATARSLQASVSA